MNFLYFIDGCVQGVVSPVVPALEVRAFQPDGVYLVMGRVASTKAMSAIFITAIVCALYDRWARSNLFRQRVLFTLVILTMSAPYAVLSILGGLSEPMHMNLYVVLDALLGSNVPFLTLANTMLVDLSIDKTHVMRSKTVAASMAYFFSGLVLSPVLSVVFVVGWDDKNRADGARRLTFVVSNVLSCMMLAYVWGTNRWSSWLLNVKPGVEDDTTTPTLSSSPRTARSTSILLAVAFCSHVAETLVASLLMIYLTTALSYTAADQAVFYIIVGAGSLMCFTQTLPRALTRFGMQRTLQLCLCAQCASLVLLASICSKRWISFLVVAVTTPFSMDVIPLCTSYAAMLGDQSRPGQMQGLLSSSKMLAEVLSPIVFGSLFSVQGGALIGFWIGAGFVVVGTVCSMWLKEVQSRSILEEPCTTSNPASSSLNLSSSQITVLV